MSEYYYFKVIYEEFGKVQTQWRKVDKLDGDLEYATHTLHFIPPYSEKGQPNPNHKILEIENVSEQIYNNRHINK